MRKLFVFCLTAFALATPLSALACTPPLGGVQHATPTEHAIAAPIVIEGTVSAVSGGSFDRSGTLQVTSYLKGSGPQTIEVSGYGSSALCRTDISVGQHSIFYIKIDPDGQWRAHQIYSSDATSPATPAIINEIKIALTIRYTPTVPHRDTAPPSTPTAAPRMQPVAAQGASSTIARLLMLQLRQYLPVSQRR